jgi:hypothetical protein
MHINNICVIIYYSPPSCFSRFCDHHQSIIQEYKQLYSLNISECTDMEHIKLHNVLYSCGGQGSSVSIATELQAGRSGDRIPVGARFSAPVQTSPGAHPASCTMGTGSFPGVKSGQGVTLTPYPLLVLWSRKGRGIPLLRLWAVRPVQSLSACTRVHFTFVFLFDMLLLIISACFVDLLHKDRIFFNV